MPKAIGQITIYDFHDVYSAAIAPTNPVKDMIWLDTSVNPPIMRVYNGSKWVMANDYSSEIAGINKVTTSHTTQINTQQGKIDTLIQDTTIIKNGVSTKLKDEYNKTVDTVNSHTQTIGSHTSTINNLTGEVEAVQTKTAEIISDLSGITQRVSSSESNITTVTATANTAKSTADTAKATATTANTTANTAKSTADTAKTTADSAKSTATSASSSASTAVSTANTAKTTADNASNVASTANTNASTALNTANSANSKIDNLQISGTNLLDQAFLTKNKATSATYDEATNTWTIVATAGAGGSLGSGLIITGKKVVVPYGSPYILSWEMKVPKACSWNSDVNNYALTGSNWGGNDNDKSSVRKTSDKTISSGDIGKWVKCWSYWENKADLNTNKVDIYDVSNFGVVMLNETENMTYQIRNVKAELANIPSEWSPSPNEVNNKISTVDTKVETATKKVAEIVTTLDSITQRVSSTESSITTVTSTANTAKSTADSAAANASTAVSTANTAKNTASTASTNASAAVSTANTAKTTADSASSVASTAKTTADTAKSTADTAKTTAATASTNAANAVSTANGALTNAKKYTDDQVIVVNQTITNKVAEIKTTTDSITQRVSSSESNISTHTTQLGTVDSRINTAKNGAIVGARSIPDTRSTNQNPQWYFTNYPKQTITEFKYANIVGIGSASIYGTLETKVPWGDSNGGYPVQIFRSNSTATYERKGTSTTAWGAWLQIEDTASSQSKANAAKSSAISTASADATTKANTAQTNAINSAKGYTDGQVTVVNKTITDKVAEIKTTTDSISQKVSSTESNVTAINNNISTLQTKMSSAEQKITDSAIIATVQKTINTAKTEAINSANSTTDTKLQSYATKASMELTASQLRLDFSSSGGMNLVKDGQFKSWDFNNSKWWWVDSNLRLYSHRTAQGTGVGFYSEDGNMTRLYSNYLNFKPNTTYTLRLDLVKEVNVYWSEVYIEFKTRDGGYISTIACSTNGYTFTTPSNCEHGYVILAHGGRANTAGGYVLWVDNVALYEGTTQLPYSPHPDEVYEGNTIIDANGITVNNGALTIKNKAGTTVFQGNNDGNLVFTGTAKSQVGDRWVGLDSGGLSFQDWNRKEQMLRMAISYLDTNRDMNGITFAMPKYSDHIRFAYIDKTDLTNGWTTSDPQYNFMDFWSGSYSVANVYYAKGIHVYAPLHIDGDGIFLRSGTSYTSDIKGAITWNNIPGILGLTGDNGCFVGYKSGDSLQARMVLTEGAHPGTDDNLTSWGHYNFNGYTAHNMKLSALSLSVSGSKNCLQETKNYGKRLINAYETTEYYFGDIGFGKINNEGECLIYIDDIFQECVNTDIKYHVFTQPYNGTIKIIERHETYFIVKGEPNTEFSWELKAKRLGYENNRLDIEEIDISSLDSGLELFPVEDFKIETSEEVLINTLKPETSEEILIDILTFELEKFLLEV